MRSTSVTKSHAFPSTTPAPPTASSSATTPVGPAQPIGRRITFRGTTTQREYRATVWASDTIRNCAAHAYGSRMIAFLRKHPCGPTHRVLATVYAGGTPVDVSVISTSFAGHGPDVYQPTEQFVNLENASGTGSINDLLREGAGMPGASGQVPFREAFEVYSQDTGVTIFDAWYERGPTRDQDPRLVHLEQDWFLSRLTTS